ncbi:MAG: aminotransferase class V-fold PLP-dependent enzyme [Bacteroidetes bacterium]|nr:aminotransferase class V-fold PLP-dependent enzyme [bacterium]NBP63735.1 aminotransferase class V-fold PLP-dependent enzyme [Bacteroidota bacterium]
MSINRRTLLKSSLLLATPAQSFAALEESMQYVSKPMGNIDFWHSIRTEFPMDRTMINLNNGGVSPSPRSVMQALHTGLDYANQAPARNIWQQQEPGLDRVRQGIASLFGVSDEEIAITRNASESLQHIQMGISLNKGDEVLTTELDYPRMITAWEQRVRRDGIILKKIPINVPVMDPGDIVSAFKKAITKNTKIIHVSHVAFCTGQIFPVRDICLLAKEKGIECIVDGAHSFAHFPFQQSDLQCDYFGTSLHKWLYAPVGNGMLYVAKDKISKIWPLMAANPDQDNSIKKFEEIGTHSAALHNAITEAVAFNERVGLANKADRLRSLHLRWIDKVKNEPGVSFMTNINDPSQWCGLMVFRFDGYDHGKIGEYLFSTHRIITTPIKYANVDGIRITPNIYISESEIDYFADILLSILKGRVKGLKS